MFNMEYYNYDYTEDILKQIANLRKDDLHVDMLYTTKISQDSYDINEYGFSLIHELNPFFSEMPNLLTFLDNNIKTEQLKLRINVLLNMKPLFDSKFLAPGSPVYQSIILFIKAYLDNNTNKALVS